MSASKRTAHTRWLGVLAAAAVLLAAPTSQATDPFDMEWRELATGVWVGVRPVSYRPPVMTNTTVVIGEKGVLVFDAAGFALQGERLVKKVAELTDKPITHIAISHWHGDHNLGDYAVLAKFPHAEVIAHEFTARYNASPNGEKATPRDPKAEGEYRAKVEKALATGVRSDGTPVTPTLRKFYVEMLEHYDSVNEEVARQQPVQPTRTMTDRLVIDLGGRTAELRHIAPGNTKGDMFLWLPEEKILATGDIVVRPTPYGFFSYPRSWAGVLRELKSFGAKTIVPGHGDIMTDTAYIEPGSPWQNPYVESFNARLRDELLNVEVFTCLDEAQVLAADWRADYNANHPHSALGMMSPARFAASWQRIGNTNVPVNPGLSLGVDR